MRIEELYSIYFKGGLSYDDNDDDHIVTGYRDIEIMYYLIRLVRKRISDGIY